jgi:hypothetical protein
VFLSSVLQFGIAYWSLVLSQRENEIVTKNAIATMQKDHNNQITVGINQALEQLIQDVDLPGHVRAALYTGGKRGGKLSIQAGHEHNMANAKDRKLTYRPEEVMVGHVWSRNFYKPRVIDLSLQETADTQISASKLKLMRDAGVATAIYVAIESGRTPNKTIAVLVIDTTSSCEEVNTANAAARTPINSHIRLWTIVICRLLELSEQTQA